MNIGDKVIPVDIAGTSSLDPNKEYIVVDINEYGNIGLKDPAAGCLLEHYYKPERLKIAPRKPIKIKLWVNTQTNLPMPNRDGYIEMSNFDVGHMFGDNEVREFVEVIK